MSEPHELFADGLLKIGWTCPNDAQWTRIKDFYAGQVGEVRKANSELSQENEALSQENEALKAEVVEWKGHYEIERQDVLNTVKRAEKAEAERDRLRDAIECNLGHISYAQFNMSEVNEMDIKGKSDSTCPEESLLIGIQGLKEALNHDKSSNR